MSRHKLLALTAVLAICFVFFITIAVNFYSRNKSAPTCISPFIENGKQVPCGIYRVSKSQVTIAYIVLKIINISEKKDRFILNFVTKIQDNEVQRKMVIPKVANLKYQVWKTEPNLSNDSKWEEIFDTPDKIKHLFKKNQYLIVSFVHYTPSLVSVVRKDWPELKIFESCLDENGPFIDSFNQKESFILKSHWDNFMEIIGCGLIPTQFYIPNNS
ncbi:hypothetical protein HGB07_03265 [Candidatus Roizmanbacteria bacterium]|nr:hypothetical protein [Candidatus Roizmanbacteria bacterium]